MKSTARPYWVSARERASTRAMLLETARKVIAHAGEAGLTLGAVADAAGLARATIYGYFSGKRDLLTALKAEDAEWEPELELAPPQAPAPDLDESEHAIPTGMDYEPVLAEFATGNTALQADEPVEGHPVLSRAEAVSSEEHRHEPAATEDVPAAVEPAAEVVAAPANESTPEAIAETQQEEVAEVHEEPAASVELQNDDAQAFTPYEKERRVQAAHLEEIAKRLILPESALKEGTDAVISRLETRLRVLERSIANLETRQQVVPDEVAKKIKPISDLVTQLQARADGIEDRQRQALAELRLSIHELSARQSVLGTIHPESVADLPAWPAAEFVPSKLDEKPAEDSSVQPAEDGEAPSDNPRTAYLLAARTLAKEGARQAAELESVHEEEQRRRRLRLVTAAGVAALCLVAVGVLFVVRPGAHGVSAAQSKALAPVATVKAHQQFDSRTSLDRLTALANKGDARAELVIGLKYLKGDGTAVNEVQAAHWIALAAQAGNPVAENHLGALYQAGRGVTADPAQAMHWYDVAALQGDRHAMSNLAVLYASGEGAPKNLAEASRWFERSANLGFVDAQFNLAVLFERGDGVPQSLLDAYKWYSIAANGGDAVAKARAEAIATQISPEELQAAQTAAANFKPQPMNRAANDVPTVADVLASAR